MSFKSAPCCGFFTANLFFYFEDYFILPFSLRYPKHQVSTCQRKLFRSRPHVLIQRETDESEIYV